MIPSGCPFAAFLWEAAVESVENQPVACSWYIQDFQACWIYAEFGILLCIGQTAIPQNARSLPGTFGIILCVEGCYSPACHD